MKNSAGNSGRPTAAILARVSMAFMWDAKMVFRADGDLMLLAEGVAVPGSTVLLYWWAGSM